MAVLRRNVDRARENQNRKQRYFTVSVPSRNFQLESIFQCMIASDCLTPALHELSSKRSNALGHRSCPTKPSTALSHLCEVKNTHPKRLCPIQKFPTSWCPQCKTLRYVGHSSSLSQIFSSRLSQFPPFVVLRDYVKRVSSMSVLTRCPRYGVCDSADTSVATPCLSGCAFMAPYTTTTIPTSTINSPETAR